MWAVVPVAGRSSRLGQAASGQPKALLEIEGRPLLDWLLKRLSHVVSDICLVVNRLDGPIRHTFGPERRGLRLHYSVQTVPLGVGDAILCAREHVTGPFVAAMGDVFYDRSLDGYVESWGRQDADGAVLTEPIVGAPDEPLGLAKVEGDFVVGIEKGSFTGQAVQRVCGLAILPETAFEVAGTLKPRSGRELELEDIIDRLIRERGCRFLALPYEGWRRNINTQEDLHFVRRRLDERIS